ncbi:MAG: hypothetical protein JW910_21440, partial [Anaerolineae bacterium]|nr:hypothetical protein [Anaerolineae bacterium]
MNRWTSPWTLLAGLVLLALVVAACGGDLTTSSLPTLAPSAAPLPHATPTFPALPEPVVPPAVNWSDTTIFRQAMCPEFADDVEAFANRNRYSIEATLELRDDLAALYGAERVRYTNRSDDTLTQVVFRLYPNLDAFSGQMNILDIQVNGTGVIPSYEQRRSVMHVPLPDGLAPGETVELLVAFNSAIERGFA